MVGQNEQSEPQVAVVVVNWHNPAATIDCVHQLQASDLRPSIVVVDNGSPAEVVEQLAALTDIELLQNPVNLGFTGGVNVGLAHAMGNGAEYVWLLNNDAIPDRDCLRHLLAFARSDRMIGLVTPVIRDPGNHASALVTLMRFDSNSLIASQTCSDKEARQWMAKSPQSVVAIGTALLVSRPLYDVIGGFDERFFAYVEDVDYSLRCTASGFKVAVCFDAAVYHGFKDPVGDPAATPVHVHYFMARNYPLLWQKHFTGSRGRAVVWFLRSRLMQMDRMQGNKAAIQAVVMGLWDGLHGIGGLSRAAERPPWWFNLVLGRYPRISVRVLDRLLALSDRASRLFSIPLRI